MRPLRNLRTSFAQRTFLAVMVSVLLFSTWQSGLSALAGTGTVLFPDTQGHWAAGAIARWADLGIIHGDSRGFRPEDPISMAEMVVLLDNLLGLTALPGAPDRKAGIGPWYGQAFEAAQLAGFLDGEDLSKVEPGDPLTWEHAAVMLAKALGVEENAGNETLMKNAGQIDSNNQLMVFGMEADGYLAGAGASGFAPKALAARAQIVAIIDLAVRSFYSAAGEFSGKMGPPDGKANCVSIVRAGGVTLKDMVMDGNLIAAEGMSGGELTLDNSVVSGNLVIRGGAGTVVRLINGAEVNGRVSVQGVGGIVQIASSGAGHLSVDVKTEALLEGNFANACAQEGSYLEVVGRATGILVTGKAKVFIGKGAEVGTIALYERAAGSVIEVEGTVASIQTEAPDTSISAGKSSKITLIAVKAEAVGTDLFLNRYSEVARVDNAATMIVSGSGRPGQIAGDGHVSFSYSVTYENSAYGFSFILPKSWEGYSIVLGEWRGTNMTASDIARERSGSIINIRHPEWKEGKPRQDIPIMVFRTADWNDLQKELFHIGAAPIGPSELGRNSKFVFALPARYNFAFPEGYEEVDRILKGDPLLATSPGL